MKSWMKITLAAIGVLAVLLSAVPFFINANTFRPIVETKLTAAVGRPVTLANLRLSLIQGSIVAKDLSIADDSGYSTIPFLKARELQIRV